MHMLVIKTITPVTVLVINTLKPFVSQQLVYKTALVIKTIKYVKLVIQTIEQYVRRSCHKLCV